MIAVLEDALLGLAIASMATAGWGLLRLGVSLAGEPGDVVAAIVCSSTCIASAGILLGLALRDPSARWVAPVVAIGGIVTGALLGWGGVA